MGPHGGTSRRSRIIRQSGTAAGNSRTKVCFLCGEAELEIVTIVGRAPEADEEDIQRVEDISAQQFATPLSSVER